VCRKLNKSAKTAITHSATRSLTGWEASLVKLDQACTTLRPYWLERVSWHELGRGDGGLSGAGAGAEGQVPHSAQVWRRCLWRAVRGTECAQQAPPAGREGRVAVRAHQDPGLRDQHPEEDAG